MSRLHWIEMPGRLAIMARPRADDWLEVDVTEWRARRSRRLHSRPERRLVDAGRFRQPYARNDSNPYPVPWHYLSSTPPNGKARSAPSHGA